MGQAVLVQVRRLLRMGPRDLPYSVLALQGLWGPGLFSAGCRAVGQAVLVRCGGCCAWGLGFCPTGF